MGSAFTGRYGLIATLALATAQTSLQAASPPSRDFSEEGQIVAAAIALAPASERPCLNSRLADLNEITLEGLHIALNNLDDAPLRQRLGTLTYRALLEKKERAFTAADRAAFERLGFRFIDDTIAPSVKAECDIVLTLSAPESDGRYAAAHVTYFRPLGDFDNFSIPLFLTRQAEGWTILLKGQGFKIVI